MDKQEFREVIEELKSLYSLDWIARTFTDVMSESEVSELVNRLEATKHD